MLEDNGRVGDEGPEVVRLQARVALEVLEKGCLVGVIVRVCMSRTLASKSIS